MHESDEDDETFLEKHGGKVIGGILALIAAGGGLWYLNREPSAPQPKPVAMVSIMTPLPPLPPPPPPPPKEPEPQPEPETVEEEQAFEPEVSPDMAEPEPDPGEPAPDPIGTGITGDGPPDGFGLSNRGGTGMPGGRIGGIGGRGGSRYGGYAAKVQTVVADAMKRNGKTRNAVMSVEVKIWADQLGRVTRAQLGRSTGDPELDRALRDEVLRGLQLSEPPPAEMPMPINLRLTARKP